MNLEVKIADWIVRKATPLFWAGLALAIICTAGFSQMQLRNDYRAFFDRNDPILERTDRLSARMGDSKEAAVLIYIPQDRDAVSALSLFQYAQLADRAVGLPFVAKTKSWYDAEKVVATGGGAHELRRALIPFTSNVDLFSPAGRHVLAGDIAASPTVNGRFIARDRSSATIILQLDLESRKGSRISKLRMLQDRVDEIEKDLKRAAPGDRILLVGSTLFDYASTEILSKDVKRLFPAAFAIIVATLFLLYRSVAFTAAGLILIFLPVSATAGLIALAGAPFSTLVVSGLLLVGTLAVADVLHVANSFFLVSENERDAAAALRIALGKNFWAITATSSTTAIGEMALLFSAAPPVRIMGLTVIVGVVIAWLLCVMMLPWVLLRIRTGRTTGAGSLSGPLSRISVFCARHPTPVLLSFASVLLISIYGITLSRIDDSMSSWFSTRTDFRQGMDLLDAQYLGLRTMTLATEVTDQDRAAADSPSTTRRLRDQYYGIQDRLSQEPGYWLSPATAAKAFYARLSVGGPSTLRLARDQSTGPLSPFSSRAMSGAGLMTQYEPGKVDYAVWYFDPRGTTTFDTLAASERVLRDARSAASNRAPTIQGVSLAFANLSARNFWSMITGSVAAFAIMTISLIIVFGSWKLGLISMIPNLAPLALIYGAWGYFDGRINMAAVSVFSVACGIVVDDTIHLILMFKRFRGHGHTVDLAIGKALESSGTGVLATTIVIASGFFLLSLSDFNLTAQKAAMVGSAIVVAFFFDLLAMPALLSVFDRANLGRAAELPA